MHPVARHVQGLTDLLLPSGCVVCGSWIARRDPVDATASDGRMSGMVCLGCRSRLTEPAWPRCPRCDHPRGTGRDDAADCLMCRDWPPALHTARSAVVLRSPASELVHALKYEGWDRLAAFMGSRMARVFAADRSLSLRAGMRPVVVPVPTTERRMRERGYNQAGLLAARVAAELGLPVRAVLERTPSGPSQTSLGAEARRENVRGVFRSGAASVAGMNVLLVDDVLTTGATAGEAASVLVDAGASDVVLLTFARALPDDATG